MRGDYETTLDPQEKLHVANRQNTKGEFQIPKSRLQKTNDNFFRRTKSLYNLDVRVFKDNEQYPNKKKLLRSYYNFFKKSFTERISAHGEYSADVDIAIP